MIVIVYGPPASGKTRHAEQLMRHFGCRQIIEDWDGTRRLHDGDIALTTQAPGAFERQAGVRVVTITDAVAALAAIEKQS